MRKPRGYQNHQCAPEEWRQTSDMTGSFELDAMILRTPNKDMRDRIHSHLLSDKAYERRTGYGGGNID